jgi:DNA primase
MIFLLTLKLWFHRFTYLCSVWRKYTYEQSKSFAELIVNIVHDELPLITSLERSPLKRKDKIYLDYLQNRPIQTICAPYSCRPKPALLYLRLCIGTR